MNTQSCEICKDKPAAVHYTEITPKGKARLDLCKDCAEQKGLLDEPGPLLDAAQGLEALISSVSKAGTDAKSAAATCARCGLQFEEFQQLGKLGCAACYEAFAKPLAPLMRKLHQRESHVMQAPSESAAPQQSMQELRAQLDAAVRDEDYETAARVRDAIKKFETRDPRTDRRETLDASDAAGDEGENEA